MEEPTSKIADSPKGKNNDLTSSAIVRKRSAVATEIETRENITTATKRAIEERLRRLGGRSRKAALLEDLADIRRRWSALQVLDDRTSEDIVGYDEHGLPR